MKRYSIFVLVVGLLVVLAVARAGFNSRAQAQSEETVSEPALASVTTPLFSYQGELRNASGTPITNPALPMTFRLYTTATGGSACWTENRNVNVQNGQFNVVLGQVTAIPSSCVIGDVYLELVIGNETLSPRELLTSVASAISSDTIKANAQTQGSLTVKGTLNTAGDIYAGGGEVCNISGTCLTGPNIMLGGETILHSNGTRVLHLLPWTGSGHIFDMVCIGCGTGNADLIISGNLDLRGSCTLTGLDRGESEEKGVASCKSGNLISGAYIEANLMSVEDRAADKVERFEMGDLLCWSGETGQLEKCSIPNDPLVMGVADANGKPIVLGAEDIKVIGRVKVGDYLVASSTPGYAMASEEPSFGIVIGQALEGNEGEMGLIKAMIRKM